MSADSRMAGRNDHPDVDGVCHHRQGTRQRDGNGCRQHVVLQAQIAAAMQGLKII